MFAGLFVNIKMKRIWEIKLKLQYREPEKIKAIGPGGAAFGRQSLPGPGFARPAAAGRKRRAPGPIAFIFSGSLPLQEQYCALRSNMSRLNWLDNTIRV